MPLCISTCNKLRASFVTSPPVRIPLLSVFRAFLLFLTLSDTPLAAKNLQKVHYTWCLLVIMIVAVLTEMFHDVSHFVCVGRYCCHQTVQHFSAAVYSLHRANTSFAQPVQTSYVVWACKRPSKFSWSVRWASYLFSGTLTEGTVASHEPRWETERNEMAVSATFCCRSCCSQRAKQGCGVGCFWMESES